MTVSNKITLNLALIEIISKCLNSADAELSENLRYQTVSTLSNEECRLFYGNQITENMVCAEGNYNQGTCIVSS